MAQKRLVAQVSAAQITFITNISPSKYLDIQQWPSKVYVLANLILIMLKWQEWINHATDRLEKTLKNWNQK